MSLDLAPDDAQQAIADAVGQFCRDHADEASAADLRLPGPLWRSLAELGVLALATEDGEGGAAELVSASEALGAHAFPGPLAATALAAQLLPAQQRARVVRGEILVSVGAGRLWPWGPRAEVWIEVDADRAWLVRPQAAVEPLATLAAEPWGRAPVTRLRELAPAAHGLALGDLALAAYLAGAGQRLVDAGSEHARTRRQFGRPIGDFQAVAHPLADCATRLAAAALLVRRAACRVDAGGADAASEVAAARLSAARAALEAAHVVHQVFGALGITLEGPVFGVSRRIRQLLALPPGEAWSQRTLLAAHGL